jgi:hypothetical protein
MTFYEITDGDLSFSTGTSHERSEWSDWNDWGESREWDEV